MTKDQALEILKEVRSGRRFLSSRDRDGDTLLTSMDPETHRFVWPEISCDEAIVNLVRIAREFGGHAILDVQREKIQTWGEADRTSWRAKVIVWSD